MPRKATTPSSETPTPPAPAGAAAGKRAAMWLEPSQVELARAILDATGMIPAFVGGPESASRTGPPLAESFEGSQPLDDPRRALTALDADLVLFLTSAGQSSADALDDAAALSEARERGLRVASLEPTPASALDSARFERDTGTPEAVRIVPSMRRARVMGHVIELLETVAPVRTLSISLRNGRGQGTLFARLFDAMDIVLALLGEPETIDASVCGPAVPGRVHLAPGDSLRQLRGDLTANLRFAHACAASVSLSDNAGRWFRGVTLVGHGGSLRFDDSSYELIDPTGKTVDASSAHERRGKKATNNAGNDLAAHAIGEQIHAMFDMHAPATPPRSTATVLAMAEAALLSARTGSPESPGTVLRMAGVH